MKAGTGTEGKRENFRCKSAEFRGAEKSGDGMALKIFARVRPSPKANTRSPGNGYANIHEP